MPIELLSVSFPSFNVRKDDFKDKKVYDNFINVVDQIQQMLVQISGVVNNNAGLEVIDPDFINPILGQPNFRANLGPAGQTGFTTGSFQLVQFNQVFFDSGSYYDNVTNFRYTPKIKGTYCCFCILQGNGINVGGMNASVFFNGSGFASNYINLASTFAVFGLQYLDLFPMNGSTDYIDGRVYFSSGTSLSLSNGSALGGFRIGP